MEIEKHKVFQSIDLLQHEVGVVLLRVRQLEEERDAIQTELYETRDRVKEVSRSREGLVEGVSRLTEKLNATKRLVDTMEAALRSVNEALEARETRLSRVYSDFEVIIKERDAAIQRLEDRGVVHQAKVEQVEKERDDWADKYNELKNSIVSTRVEEQ